MEEVCGPSFSHLCGPQLLHPLPDDKVVYSTCLTFHLALPERMGASQRNILSGLPPNTLNNDTAAHTPSAETRTHSAEFEARTPTQLRLLHWAHP